MKDNDSLIMAQRLKQLRCERKFSHEKLSKIIKDKYGEEISTQSLKNYEVSDPNHSKAYKNNGMSVKYLRIFSDFYGVSADYILGLTNDPNTEPSAVDDLGLNPTVVWGIKELNGRKANKGFAKSIATIDILNVFLEKSLRSVIFYEMIRELKESVDREHSAKSSSIIRGRLSEFAAADPAHEQLVIEAMLRSKIREEFPELIGRFSVVYGAQCLKTLVDEICDFFRDMLEDITGYKKLKEG